MPKTIQSTIDQRNLLLIKRELSSFTKKAIKKYQKGRKEHNDDLSELGYDTEIESELIDLLMYMILRRLFKK